MERGSKVGITILLVASLIILLLVGGIRMFSTTGISPGPEGVSVYNYGVIFQNYPIAGTTPFFKFGAIPGGQWIITGGYPEYNFALKQTYAYNLAVKLTYPDPNTVVIYKVWTAYPDHFTNLIIEHSTAPVSAANARGLIPDGWVAGQNKYIEYVRILEESETVKKWQKYVVHLVPVDFIIQTSVRGFRDNGWENVMLWFALDTTVWYNAYTTAQIEDRMENPLPPNATRTAYYYRGGFPIFAFIKDWDPMVWQVQENGQDVGETPSPPVEARNNVEIYPSLEGRALTLYTGDPATAAFPDEYRLVLAKDILESPTSMMTAVYSLIPALPDPRMTPTVWFKILASKFGPYSIAEGPPWDPWGSWKGWWPSTFMRVRVIYGLYGEFIYLWTKQEEEEWGYQWQNRTTQYDWAVDAWTAFWRGAGQFFGGIANWLANPFNQLWLFFILIVIVVVVLAVVAPGVLMALTRRKEGG